MSDSAETYYFLANILLYILTGLGITLLAVVIGSPFYFWNSDHKAFKRKFESAFENRQALNEIEFYDLYFRDKGLSPELVKKIRRVLEDELGADLSRLDSKDSFSTNLGFFFEHDSLVDVELVMRLEEEFDIAISDGEAAAVSTIESIVELVSTKLGKA